MSGTICQELALRVLRTNGTGHLFPALEPFTERLIRSFARFAFPNLFGLFKGSTIWVASGADERLRRQGRRR